MSTLIPNEDVCLEKGFNVLLVGPHGTGKSATVRSLAERKKLRVAIFNCATMDPYTDLIGVPMPKEVIEPDGTTHRVLEMVAPNVLDDADVVFLDELNRGSAEIHNACLELLNERTLNGRPLHKLKMVVAAINPPGDDHGYRVQELEPALRDRFKVKVNVSPTPLVGVLEKHDGLPKPVARALVRWWKDHDHKKRETYISPRRLAAIGQVFMAAPEDRKFFDSAIPDEFPVDGTKLFHMLSAAIGKELPRSEGDKELEAVVPEAEEVTEVKTVDPKRDVDSLIEEYKDAYGKTFDPSTFEDFARKVMSLKVPLKKPRVVKVSPDTTIKKVDIKKFLRPVYGGDKTKMSIIDSSYSYEEIRECIASWSQPSQSSFRIKFTVLVMSNPDYARHCLTKLIHAIDSITRQPSKRIGPKIGL